MIAHSLRLSTVTQRPLQDHFVTTLTGLLVRPRGGDREGIGGGHLYTLPRQPGPEAW